MVCENSYLNLCTQFYDLSKPAAPKDAYDFYGRYAEQANGRILEPMCGTGRFLLPLAEDGYQIEGSDISPHMLAALHKKAEDKNICVNVWQSMADKIPEGNAYSLIFIPSGSFGLIIEKDQIMQTLKSFYNHLNDGGILVFETETQHALPELGVWRGTKQCRQDGKIIMLSLCASVTNDICTSIAKYELISGNKVIDTEIEEYRIKIYEQSELLDLLNTIGFRYTRAIKAYRHDEAPTADDSVIIYECQK